MNICWFYLLLFGSRYACVSDSLVTNILLVLVVASYFCNNVRFNYSFSSAILYIKSILELLS